jgi:nicotinamide mononucleotide transporter
MEQIYLYISGNIIEVIALILSIVYIYLSINQRLSTWFFGFLCSILYIIVFFQTKFYAGMALQIYYAAISVYGWFSWRNGNSSSDVGLLVTKTSAKLLMRILAVSVFLFLVIYFILKKYTDSPIPLPDAYTTSFSLVATWMLTRKKLEHWIFWIFIDVASVAMFLYRGMYPTVILFVIYTVMAVTGYFRWNNSMKKNTPESL